MGKLPLKTLLNASYQSQKDAQSTLEKRKKPLKLDTELSTMQQKVFVNENNNRPIILHRGTTTVRDKVDDGLIAFGLGKYGFRYNDAVRVNKKAEAKYGKVPVNVGHSYGGWLAENTGKGKVITYNKAAGLGDIGKQISKKQTDFRTSNDPVSALSTTQSGGKKVTIEAKKLPILSHSTDEIPNSIFYE